MARQVSREEILDAIRPLCSGDRQPPMEQLAATAGVSLRTLYRMFGSRSALLHELGTSPPPSARDLILAAALELVGREGLAELSMEELAGAAGVSRATLYRLFPGKSALFAALVRTYAPWEAVADAIDAMPDGPPGEVIPAVARAIESAVEGRTGLLLRIVFEILKGDPDTVEGVRHSLGRGLPDLIQYLSRQMSAGRLRRMHPVVAFQLLAGPIVVHQLTRPLAERLLGFRASPERVTDQIVQAWLRSMARDSAPGAGPSYDAPPPSGSA
ncbi:MAG: TetR family transcriptional regulator [Candidatus Dormibacteraeota bacterium]|nr:TetR family transcriptional regulator [Candidatus Dormibacteraeota bacterium]